MIAAEVAQVFGELRDNARRWLRQAVITTSNPRVTVTTPSARVLEVVTAATAGDLLDGLVTP